jgi:hypothetical protein
VQVLLVVGNKEHKAANLLAEVLAKRWNAVKMYQFKRSGKLRQNDAASTPRTRRRMYNK